MRIAFFCIPAHGHTNPTLEVVRELTARGHEVLYYSYKPFREKIEAAGAVFVACDDFDAELHLSEKDAARILVRNTMQYMDFMGCEIIVRINSIDTPYWKKDLDLIMPYKPGLPEFLWIRLWRWTQWSAKK